MAQTQIREPTKLFQHELGMALGAERKVHTMLKKLEQKAQREELKQQFRHHREETEGQIRNLEQAFESLGAKPTGHHAEVADGLAAETEKMIGMVDPELIDTVLLGGAAKTEHVEIAMYEDLIAHAAALGQQEIVPLLQENLEQEQHTLEEVKRATQKVAQQGARQVV
jgi:ferritin-like metal-binding protein YciE